MTKANVNVILFGLIINQIIDIWVSIKAATIVIIIHAILNCMVFLTDRMFLCKVILLDMEKPRRTDRISGINSIECGIVLHSISCVPKSGNNDFII